MNNLFENPWAMLIGAILFLIGGTLMVANAPDLIIFSRLVAFAGKVIIFTGACFTALAIYLLSH